MMNRKGVFCVSLDFELMWGGIELWTPDGYGQTNIKQVPEVIERLLTIFEKYGIHATFGTVGFLMLDGVEELKDCIPTLTPSYVKREYSPYHREYMCRISKRDEPLYFAPSLVQKIRCKEGMEVGSHTYCHYYCWEEGQSLYEFEKDVEMGVEIANHKGVVMDSIIFPRNQVNEEYLSICSNSGYKAYRGCAKRFFENKVGISAIIQKVLRLIDNYIPISGRTSFRYSEIEKRGGMYNIPASRFLRPYSRLTSFLDNIRINRIKREIRYAAKHGEIYHIWWHPHNMGSHIDENFNVLEEVLKSYKDCREMYGMVSMNMGEIALNLSSNHI